jgi:uridine kinase
VDGDSFYQGGTAQEWDAMNPLEKAERCMDWRRQRTVLAELSAGKEASWFGYDWAVHDGNLMDVAVLCEPASVVILDGVYSARPELADLVDLRVLLDTPVDVREEQLLRREGDVYRAEWEARWSEGEGYYFGVVMPPEAFDLVLNTSAGR